MSCDTIQPLVGALSQTSAQGATHASTSYHSIYKLGGVYPEP